MFFEVWATKRDLFSSECKPYSQVDQNENEKLLVNTGIVTSVLWLYLKITPAEVINEYDPVQQRQALHLLHWFCHIPI